MKKYIYLALYSLIVFSCKKQEQQNTAATPGQDQSYLANVKAYLKKNLYDSDYKKVDFNNSVLSKQGTDWFLRIAFLNRKLSSDFVLLQTDSIGDCKQGKFVHIRRDSSNMRTFNGKISIASFQHVATVKKITDNAVATVDCAVAEETVDDDGCDAIVPADDCTGCLPEIIVVGYAGGGGSAVSYSDYVNLSDLVNAGSYSTGASSGIYSKLIPGSTAGTGSISPSTDLTINYESDAGKPGIDVNAFMKCFTEIPDAGATCSVTVYSDLPVNDNPSYIFNILSGATGHCFMQLTKTNGAQSVTQVIGKTTSKAIAVLGFPVAGKIVDNTAHKYNASITMNISPAQLTTEINAVVAAGSNPPYDMWENNCVNYAVGILNLVRPSNPLDVGLSLDPSSDEEYETPQGLYIALNNLKAQNGADAANITMDVVDHAATSHGPCN